LNRKLFGRESEEKRRKQNKRNKNKQTMVAFGPLIIKVLTYSKVLKFIPSIAGKVREFYLLIHPNHIIFFFLSLSIRSHLPCASPSPSCTSSSASTSHQHQHHHACIKSDQQLTLSLNTKVITLAQLPDVINAGKNFIQKDSTERININIGGTFFQVQMKR